MALPKKKLLTKNLTFFANERLDAAIRECAEWEGVTVSDWMRQAARDKVENTRMRREKEELRYRMPL